MHDQLKTCNEGQGLRALNCELEAHLTDDRVAEDYASIAKNEDNAAATLTLLSHHMEELKASMSRISDSAAANIANEGFVIAGSPVFGDEMTRGFIGSRLPNLELLHFNGSPTQWQPFWDMFRHVVFENSSLSNIRRFHYLKSLVTGQASNAMDHIQYTEQLYEDTIILQ